MLRDKRRRRVLIGEEFDDPGCFGLVGTLESGTAAGCASAVAPDWLVGVGFPVGGDHPLEVPQHHLVHGP